MLRFVLELALSKHMYILLHSAIIDPLSVSHSDLSLPGVFSSRTVSSSTSQSCQILKKSSLRSCFRIGSKMARIELRRVPSEVPVLVVAI